MIKKIAIAGGGIAGLTAANALCRAGFEVEVFEAAPHISAVGAGIWMAPNAMTVLERLELSKQVVLEGCELKFVAIVNKNQEVLQSLNQKITKTSFGHGITAIHRADLQKILLKSLPDGVVKTGKKIKSFSQQSDYVHIEFKDGESCTADLLIGADGVNSTVRQSLFPDRKVNYTGQLCWRGVCEMELPEEFKSSTREAWGKEIRFGFSEIGKGKVYWFAVQSGNPLPVEIGMRKDYLLQHYAEFQDPVLKIINATHNESILESPLTDLKVKKNWYQDRVVLIGDAAHASTPNMGQGAAQGMVDAWVLTESLKSNADHQVAFKEFQNKRYRKVKSVVNTSRKIGEMAHWTYGTAFRDFLMRVTPESISFKQMKCIYEVD